eukprot:10215854-Prorocentrum_lima.AAC.1
MSCKLLFHFVIEAAVASGPDHVGSTLHLHLVFPQLLFLAPECQQERRFVGCYRDKLCDFDG